MPTLNPHLFFNGQAEEAFGFYQSVFGGEIAGPYRYKDTPGGNFAPEEQEKLMHVGLPVGKTMLMGADWHPGAGAYTQGHHFAVYIDTDNKQQADAYFNGLAEGGRVNMPIADTFWGSYFGMVTDKFGVDWMIAFDLNKTQQP